MTMTKENILTISSRLFYERGIANVRLQQIADNAKISVGNLAYHYPNKQAIVNAIYRTAFDELSELMDTIFYKDDFADFDDSIKSFFRFQVTYGFCFNNVWEISRNYPHLHQQWKTISNRMVSQIQKRFAAFGKDNLVKPEPFKSSYKILSEELLLHFLCWVAQQTMRGKSATLLSFRRTSWALLFPYFTDKGINKYRELGID